MNSSFEIIDLNARAWDCVAFNGVKIDRDQELQFHYSYYNNFN